MAEKRAAVHGYEAEMLRGEPETPQGGGQGLDREVADVLVEDVVVLQLVAQAVRVRALHYESAARAE
jgi:hypothetical protein